MLRVFCLGTRDLSTFEAMYFRKICMKNAKDLELPGYNLQT